MSMERLTNRYDDGEAFCDKFSVIEDVGVDETILKGELIDKLADYEDAEEEGLLKILPVAIGSDVYFIPNKVNYELNVLNSHEENNRVYHQKVANIVFNERGWYLKCNLDLEYGVDHILVDKLYKETWFTSEEEAEQALADMKKCKYVKNNGLCGKNPACTSSGKCEGHCSHFEQALKRMESE